MPQRTGDPDFAIVSPSANDVLIPTFSVWGTCPQGTPPPSIVVSAGCNPPQTITPSALTPTTWEAIFSGAAQGEYTITASYNSGPTLPPVPVQVSSTTGLTVKDVIRTTAAAAKGKNPWGGVEAGGEYPPDVTGVSVYVTQDGNQVSSMHAARLDDGFWFVNLGFMSSKVSGSNFCLHVRATGSDGHIRGSASSFFSVPSSPETE
jgi:hypothetical protein